MTHEFKQFVDVAYKNQNIKHVLATVVALDGSSYRKPGVQMLISEYGTMTGAVSGGCVEKEVLFQSQSVFLTNCPKVITYNGTFRLGCEGILYILIEPFKLTTESYTRIQTELQERRSMEMTSYFEKRVKQDYCFGSTIKLSDNTILNFRADFKPGSNTTTRSQNFTAIPQLVIFGGEHDAVALYKSAALLGWDIKVIASPRNPITLENFPEATKIYYQDPSMEFDFILDEHTAVVLMNHNYARDLQFFLQIQAFPVYYIAVLGSVKRRERLIHDLIEFAPDADTDFTDTIYSPAGIHIGAITPQEIAISILSEMIAVKRNKEVPSLRNYLGSFHY
ncbi:XdhC family protein [Formosa sp. S-31]|uniref:XdhC family protein n=1 Tax=Formosa sp. S-31 TaxID=2790949 RepID=UPI003EB865CA